jgi:hypothetical protein
LFRLAGLVALLIEAATAVAGLHHG